MELILKYFPDISSQQIAQFTALENLYHNWNQKINLISRRDMDHLYERHLLHSLGIAKIQAFLPESHILDVGTGGGFPGIPLAILYPDCHFHLVDSIGKKIKVVEDISQHLSLKHISASQQRVENIQETFDFTVSRAVTHMNRFVPWVKDKIKTQQRHERPNGILYLKGGDLKEELQSFPKAQCFQLSEYFEESFFESKKVVYLPITKK